MFEMTTLSIPGVLPDRPLMSSKEISKLTGKRHSDILRDIRSVLNELYADDYHNAKLRYEKNQLLTIVEGIVVNIDYRGMEGEYMLDRKHTDVLITGYSLKYRAAVIERWHELEMSVSSGALYGAYPSIPETFSEALRLAADLEEQRADLERKLSVARPKAILMDTICGTADELYGLNEAGRILRTSGAVLGALMDSLGDVYVKRKYTTVNRQFLKIFIDRGYGKNVVIGNGRNQAKFTFKGLCFAAVKLIAAGKITASAIEYEPCREHVEREMKESKCLH
ncbi:Rha family transcriptional regulator [Salmonella enterica]